MKRTHLILAGTYTQACMFLRERKLDPAQCFIPTTLHSLLGIDLRGVTVHRVGTWRSLPTEFLNRLDSMEKLAQ